MRAAPEATLLALPCVKPASLRQGVDLSSLCPGTSAADRANHAYAHNGLPAVVIFGMLPGLHKVQPVRMPARDVQKRWLVVLVDEFGLCADVSTPGQILLRVAD